MSVYLILLCLWDSGLVSLVFVASLLPSFLLVVYDLFASLSFGLGVSQMCVFDMLLSVCVVSVVGPGPALLHLSLGSLGVPGLLLQVLLLVSGPGPALLLLSLGLPGLLLRVPVHIVGPGAALLLLSLGLPGLLL